MTTPRWYFNIPPTEAVADHESRHPRPNGIHLNTIDTQDHKGKYITLSTDDWSYGEWICHHRATKHFEAYNSIFRLKVVGNDIYLGAGFTSYILLSSCSWANDCDYFPVDDIGLPSDYKRYDNDTQDI